MLFVQELIVKSGFNSMIVFARLQMVQDPTQFDVLVMPNLYGDILRLVHTKIINSAYLVVNILVRGFNIETSFSMLLWNIL